jgi:ribosomal protein S18 acetylase RimI-like enzyme
MSISFRAVTAADIDVVVAMMQDFYAIDSYPMDTHTSRGLLAQFLENKELGRSWLILNNGNLIGYAIITFIFSFEYKGRIAFLDELYIIPEGRGLGAGSKAVGFIQAQAKLHSVKLIYLEVEDHNEAAQKLYLSKDFIRHNRKLMKYAVDFS